MCVSKFLVTEILPFFNSLIINAMNTVYEYTCKMAK